MHGLRRGCAGRSIGNVDPMAWAAVLDLLLPSVCPRCRVAPGPLLCPGCAADLEEIADPCPWCAEPRAGAARCPVCDDRGLAHCDRVTVQWVYDGVLRDLVGIAKIEGRAAAVAACAALLPPLDLESGSVVVPVPPSPGRRPGPHLATALAAAVARHHRLPLRRWLRQVRPAAEQHRLNRADRMRNVEGLFRARPLTAPVVLVDDLITSGATVIMAAAALKAAGAPQVQVVALGRTV